MAFDGILSQRKLLFGPLVIQLAWYVLKQLFTSLSVLWQTKSTVSFPLENKHVVNEHHLIRKNHDATQKKCPHVVHLNVPRDKFEPNSRYQKRHSEDGKKYRGCRGLLGRIVSHCVLIATKFQT